MGCNVLDLNDYNNNRATLDGRNGPDDPVEQRVSPGPLWWRATRSKNSVLVGYNFPVSASGNEELIDAYKQALTEFHGKIPAKELQQVAWLVANLRLKADNRHRGRLNACAYDDDYYYFIAFYPPYPDTPRARLTEPEADRRARKVHGLYKIPLNSIGENTTDAFTTEVAGPLEVPGASIIDLPGEVQ